MATKQQIQNAVMNITLPTRAQRERALAFNYKHADKDIELMWSGAHGCWLLVDRDEVTIGTFRDVAAACRYVQSQAWVAA